MMHAENKITIKHEEREYCATYSVDDGVVTLMMMDKDGTHRGCSTFVNGSTAESVARSLFWELLKDMSLA
jgi:hypothetical protein